MAISNIKVKLPFDIEKVWSIVTSLENYSWRSDLSKVEILELEKQFVEHTKSGYSTLFTITAYELNKRYEFDMENENMKGHWTGIFSFEEGETTVDFTENVIAKKIFMKPFVKSYLRKQQASYIKDLKKALEE